eukprot:551990-Pleurochrysis_carterae.AAC.1
MLHRQDDCLPSWVLRPRSREADTGRAVHTPVSASQRPCWRRAYAQPSHPEGYEEYCMVMALSEGHAASHSYCIYCMVVAMA